MLHLAASLEGLKWFQIWFGTFFSWCSYLLSGVGPQACQFCLYFKPSQLRRVMGSQLTEGLLHLIKGLSDLFLGCSRLMVLWSWLWMIAIKAISRCQFRGYPSWLSGGATGWSLVFSLASSDILYWAYGNLWGIGACFSTWSLHAWGRVLFDYGGFLDSFKWLYSLGLCSSIAQSSTLTSSPTMVRHILWEATSATNFLVNWACTHQVSRCFLDTRDFPVGLSGFPHLDA